MFRRLHYCLFLLLFFSIAPAQESRLENVLKEAKENKINPKIILEIETLVAKSNNDTLNIKAYKFLGDTYRDLEVYEKANQLYQKSLFLAKKNRLTKKIGARIADLAELQRLLANYEKSLQLFTESKKYFEKANDSDGITRVNGNIAAIFIA
uniref:hypothetical protein n=1 Tax=Flavobacterium sp. TaxID=239 RepID=UPI002626D866